MTPMTPLTLLKSAIKPCIELDAERMARDKGYETSHYTTVENHPSKICSSLCGGIWTYVQERTSPITTALRSDNGQRTNFKVKQNAGTDLTGGNKNIW